MSCITAVVLRRYPLNTLNFYQYANSNQQVIFCWYSQYIFIYKVRGIRERLNLMRVEQLQEQLHFRQDVTKVGRQFLTWTIKNYVYEEHGEFDI